MTTEELFAKLKEKNQATIARTPAPGCPACETFTIHVTDEELSYHPLMGHGFTKESGYTYNVETGLPFAPKAS